mgnify:FL=1
MKNKLAENMLRFGTKNLTESQLENIQEIELNESYSSFNTSVINTIFDNTKTKTGKSPYDSLTNESGYWFPETESGSTTVGLFRLMRDRGPVSELIEGDILAPAVVELVTGGLPMMMPVGRFAVNANGFTKFQINKPLFVKEYDPQAIRRYTALGRSLYTIPFVKGGAMNYLNKYKPQIMQGLNNLENDKATLENMGLWQIYGTSWSQLAKSMTTQQQK